MNNIIPFLFLNRTIYVISTEKKELEEYILNYWISGKLRFGEHGSFILYLYGVLDN